MIVSLPPGTRPIEEPLVPDAQSPEELPILTLAPPDSWLIFCGLRELVARARRARRPDLAIAARILAWAAFPSQGWLENPPEDDRVDSQPDPDLGPPWTAERLRGAIVGAVAHTFFEHAGLAAGSAARSAATLLLADLGDPPGGALGHYRR